MNSHNPRVKDMDSSSIQATSPTIQESVLIMASPNLLSTLPPIDSMPDTTTLQPPDQERQTTTSEVNGSPASLSTPAVESQSNLDAETLGPSPRNPKPKQKRGPASRPIRNQRFNKPCILGEHTHEHGGRYECLQCGVTFRERYSLSNHEKVHAGPFSCAICSKTFRKRASLRQHMQNHDPNRRMVKCRRDGCQSKYLRTGCLNRHVKSAHDKEEYSCTFCGKIFTRSDLRDRHERTHDEGRKQDVPSTSTSPELVQTAGASPVATGKGEGVHDQQAPLESARSMQMPADISHNMSLDFPIPDALAISGVEMAGSMDFSMADPAMTSKNMDMTMTWSQAMDMDTFQTSLNVMGMSMHEHDDMGLTFIHGPESAPIVCYDIPMFTTRTTNGGTNAVSDSPMDLLSFTAAMNNATI
ncbi:uncharacterized protein Z518_10895 [Rhinocladiella mackenziei CBS 650.93]|uniref:C2H2-type domain-containing protein n=1 Tax=Rhinocladiella mackenziei CBS 650.93 TaxID=1442369 RepID=A0A0D2GNP0_9EURO|nr:uncharacterized protein Z518_10895 [Rhinocladiella mackenziei CBS 650.93]KIW99967.1 hypothetical protein Z518_10895 [Rhinocladiella mackenziei CBS 650.93]